MARNLFSSRLGRISLTLLVAIATFPMSVFLFSQRGGSRASEPAQKITGSSAIRMPKGGVAIELILGVNDKRPTDWNGEITITAGKLVSIENLNTGKQLEGSRWRLRSTAPRATKNKKKKSAASRKPVPVRLRATIQVAANSTVEVVTAQGRFSFALAEISGSEPQQFLVGRATVGRSINTRVLANTNAHEDFPATVTAPNGTVWSVYVAYQMGNPIDQRETDAGRFDALRTRGNGDQIRLTGYANDEWSAPIAVTGGGLDVWRPAIAVDAQGIVWVLWSQQVDGNWDVFARGFDPKAKTISEIHRLTTDAAADINVAAVGATVQSGWRDQRGIQVAWQAKRNGNFDIRTAYLVAGKLDDEKRVSISDANDWNPGMAAASNGDVWISWDTYDKGDYDVYMRRLSKGKLSDAIPIATSTRYEARPSIVVDAKDRVWVAFEDSGSNWGKDYGSRLVGQGIPFYYERNIIVRCLTDEGLMQTLTAPRSAVMQTWFDDKRYKAQFHHRISFPRLCLDGEGNPWLWYRRHPNPTNTNGERWLSYARYLDGGEWSAEIPIDNSLNLLDNRPALSPLQGGGLMAIYSSDDRTTNARSAKICNLHAAVLSPFQKPKPPALVSIDSDGDHVAQTLIDPEEADNVERCRNFRIKVGGKELRLLRGEFHRHTEISAHRDWDGPLEEVWRYGLDVAAMDWIGPGDHDYGVGHEYMWWLTQKQTDLYHDPDHFLPMYTYERSVRYPSGHRNVMFAERGIRPLPQMRTAVKQFGTAEDGSTDIKNLYKFLKFYGGICSSHTSATNMGTDWRDSDPEVEPVVEIMQGHRQNYEETNAPLAARNEADTIQGYKPAGFVWEAFKKNIRLGFQCSSDHVSTHISYAFVLTDDPTRQGIIDAFKRRHCYAAHDNIILDVRCGKHIMGDEFASKKPPKLDVHVIGTDLIARIDIVRHVGDAVPEYVYHVTPNKREVQFSWTDAAVVKGTTNMYYVRIQQRDARMAWASPMWIDLNP